MAPRRLLTPCRDHFLRPFVFNNISGWTFIFEVQKEEVTRQQSESGFLWLCATHYENFDPRILAPCSGPSFLVFSMLDKDNTINRKCKYYSIAQYINIRVTDWQENLATHGLPWKLPRDLSPVPKRTRDIKPMPKPEQFFPSRPRCPYSITAPFLKNGTFNRDHQGAL
jgi:hypothetical protein